MEILRRIRALHWFWRTLGVVVLFLVLLFVAWMLGRAHDPAAILGLVIITGIVASYLSRRVARTLETLDWRFRTILFATIASLVCTLFVYSAGIWQDVATFPGAAFAAWFSGVLFFALVGAIVAAVSVVKPEQESFDSRARILFRRQYGPHIDYIIGKIKSEFEQYAQQTTTKFVIEGYHAGEKKYRVRTEDDTLVHSYLDDVRTRYRSSIRLTEVTLPPQGGERNRLSFVRIGADHQPGEEFDSQIDRPVSTNIEPFGSCLVAHEMIQWVLESTEPVEHATARYTNQLSLTSEFYHLDGANLSAHISLFSPSPIGGQYEQITREVSQNPGKEKGAPVGALFVCRGIESSDSQQELRNK